MSKVKERTISVETPFIGDGYEARWSDDPRGPVGKGDTVDDAIEDLKSLTDDED